MGACSMLPRIIGQGRAAELLYTGRSMQADEAFANGFYNRLCHSENVIGEAQLFAKEMAEGPTVAHKITKAMLNQEWHMPLYEAV